ncbi:MAG: hypothetical protein Ct9H300mP11_24510 [Chloroflexota bacterium]|nr:MAG: hypothetical protein Ct9H300mP11_24510 [Chloroflexota bacterium]
MVRRRHSALRTRLLQEVVLGACGGESAFGSGNAEFLGTHVFEGFDTRANCSDGLDTTGKLHLLRHLFVKLDITLVIGA